MHVPLHELGPSIVFSHLADRRDLADLVAGVRLIRDVVAQPAWRRYNRGELTPAILDSRIRLERRKHLNRLTAENYLSAATV